MTSGGEKAIRKKEFKYPPSLITGMLRGISFTLSKLFWFIRYRGLKNIPRCKNGFVLVSNHPTYFDPVWISIPVHRNMRFMAWDHAFEWPYVGELIRFLGAFPVKTDGSVTKTAIVESLRTIRGDGVLVIFPEGEREFDDGKLLEFKTGALHVALNAHSPVLPVSIRGGNRIWPQVYKYPRLFSRVEVTYHPLMYLPECPPDVELDQHLAKLNDELIKIIASAI
jgi:1-acyl-sn-glycerol-3-phosphate acyltransferase